MEKLGYVQKSSSTWASQLHMVIKDSEWKPCDNKQVNAQTVSDGYLILHYQDYPAAIFVFFHIDLVKAFH